MTNDYFKDHKISSYKKNIYCYFYYIRYKWYKCKVILKKLKLSNCLQLKIKIKYEYLCIYCTRVQT